MKATVSLALAVAVGLSFATQANAQHDHDAHHGAPASATTAQSGPMSEGVVQKVDKAGKKVTIKHGDLKNLGMGPMTMPFQVKDPVILEKVDVGDKVKFVAEMAGGKLAVSKLDVVK
ncbi:copper-binding protein [Noviherbaspirillum denitrificans]|uniref:RND transporter n=1 Tax=Noviherbaspirillum denitrificans TaxID=1968433 RepID=A0A254TJ83_9BURK|nr:copper-binding protein [Noviherbaspirillum denitrificans]OWW22634.1 hypothetical protein AYR66_27170 [Noviherbaspirillum denitrificans]